MGMDGDAQAWVAEKATGFLRRVGLRRGQTVLDFGCNRGNYAKPAAKIVGARGTVYAVDKDCGTLDELKRAASEKQFWNVQCLCVSEDGEIPLHPCSIDVVLVYDVLHRCYFPEETERRQVLQNVRRGLRADGLLSFYLTHLKKYGITFDSIIRETEAMGFELCGESCRKLAHDGRVVRRRVFSYRPVRDWERPFKLPQMRGDNR